MKEKLPVFTPKILSYMVNISVVNEVRLLISCLFSKNRSLFEGKRIFHVLTKITCKDEAS